LRSHRWADLVSCSPISANVASSTVWSDRAARSHHATLFHNGKIIPLAGKIAAVLKELPSVEEVIIIDYSGAATDISSTLPMPRLMMISFLRELAPSISRSSPSITRSMFLLFGTTGIPKCIVHRAAASCLST